MRVMYPGHLYALDHLDGSKVTRLQFIQRQPHHKGKEGVTNQEVLRALIDRVEFLDRELPHMVNEQILHHLRMALVLHEARALVRHVEKGELKPEQVCLNQADGHFKFRIRCSF
jgi:hypothetical protein